MHSTSLNLIRLRLAKLSAHIVVALIALVVIGGSTRVMEAGLACPDWPLCFGTLFPGRQMNIQVFLEWFHRLDAFVVGLAVCVQFFFALIYRAILPKWLPWISAFLVLIIASQGALGALTVLDLLPSLIVTAHLGVALVLVAMTSAITQVLLSTNTFESPLWWRLLGGVNLFAVITQCLFGGSMASSWAAQRCINQGQSCQPLLVHQGFAVVVSVSIFIFVVISLSFPGWVRSQWPFLLSLLAILCLQILLGVFTLKFGLAKPVLTVGHQFLGALLVALLSALTFRKPEISLLPSKFNTKKVFLEPCHG